MAGVTVHVEGLAELIRKVTIDESLIGELADVLAEESLELLDRMRGSGRPTAGGRGDGLVPIETGRLLNSLQPDVNGLRLEVSSDLDYAAFARFKGEQVGAMNAELGLEFAELPERVGPKWRAILNRRLGL